MTATFTPPKPARAAPAGPPVVRSDHSLVSDAEQRRWVVPLVLSFTWAAAFFAASIGTGKLWLMAPAGLGVGLLILGFVYLGLTSDTNRSA